MVHCQSSVGTADGRASHPASAAPLRVAVWPGEEASLAPDPSGEGQPAKGLPTAFMIYFFRKKNFLFRLLF
jgi:hypothetical protein